MKKNETVAVRTLETIMAEADAKVNELNKEQELDKRITMEAEVDKLVKDYKTWLPQAENRHQALEWIKYYLFLKKDHPLGAKLGVPQKLSYLAIPFLIVIMFWTGLCLWNVTMMLPFFWGTTTLLGGLMSVRIIHYFMMFVFILFMFIHIYLANVEGTAPTKLMFFHKEHGGLVYDPNIHNIVGYEEEVAEEEEDVLVP